jgi:TP901 family phage tail tape measure protein
VPVDYDLGTARGRVIIDHAQLGAATQALRTFGLATAAVGIAAAAGFAMVVKSAADFEKQMDAVQAVSGASRAEMKLLTEQALDLSTKTVFSASEISGAMQALAKAGIPVQDMLDGATQATIHLAAAAGDELPGGVQRAAEIIANAQKTFNASAEDMEHFADVLVGAAASSTISVEDMANSFRYAGPIAHELGLSIDDLGAALAILGDRGIKGSTAGTSLRGVLISLSPTSEKAKNALRDLGLITEDGTNKFFDMNGALKPLPEVMQLLQDATSGLSEEQKIQAFNTIFQRRAMNSALILAELGAAGFDKYAQAIAGIDASDVAAAKLDNLSGDVKILMNSIDALIKRAGAPLQEFFRNIAQGLTGFVQRLNEVDPKILSLIVTIIGAVGVFLLLVGATALMASMFLRAYGVILNLFAGVKLLIGMFQLLSITLLTNPIFLIIAAIVLFAAAVWLAYQRSETFREAWNKLFEDLRPIFETVGRFIKNFVEGLGTLWEMFQEGELSVGSVARVIDDMFGGTGRLIGPIHGLVDVIIALKNAAITAFDYFADHVLPTMIEVGRAIVSGIGVAIGWLINTGIPGIQRFGSIVAGVAQDIFNWMSEHVFPVFADFATLVAAVAERVIQVWKKIWPVIEFLGKVVLGVVMFIAGLFDDFIQTAITLWNYFGDNLIDAITIAFNFVKGIVESVLQIIRGIIQIFIGIVTLDWNTFWTGLTNVVGGVWNYIVNGVTTALSILRLIIETAIDAIVAVWKIAWDLVSTILDSAWQLISNIINNVIGFIMGLIMGFFDWLIFGSVWTDAWNACVAVLQGAWEAIKNAISAAIAILGGWIGALPGKILGWLGDLAGLLWSKGWDLISGFLNGIVGKAGEVISWFTGLAGKVLGWIGDLARTLWNAGRDLIQGFIDGITSKLRAVGDALGRIKDSIPSWVDGPLGIFSPSKFMMWRGEMLMRGLQEGIKREMGPLEKLMRQVTPTLDAGLGVGASSFGGGGGNTVNVTFEFPGVRSAKDIDQIEQALGSSEVIKKILHAARAGVGRR